MLKYIDPSHTSVTINKVTNHFAQFTEVTEHVPQTSKCIRINGSQMRKPILG
jgi:hypothetical protein